MVYPFLPVFGRLLGVDLGTMSLALSARSATGALGPLLAPFTDRRGRRFGLSLGLGLFAAGAFLGLAGPGFIAFAAALILMTVGKYVIDPAVLAHLSDVVPYAEARPGPGSDRAELVPGFHSRGPRGRVPPRAVRPPGAVRRPDLSGPGRLCRGPGLHESRCGTRDGRCVRVR